ncbi:MAG: hypothetical protein D6753_00630 [Planctomycetota bacterium]|nr:MAG: hypothetical protein D6753_00630 [Planctomycetota bacterium]
MRCNRDWRSCYRPWIGALLLVLFGGVPAWYALSGPADSAEQVYQRAMQDMQQGNYRDAFQRLHDALRAPEATPALIRDCLPRIRTCLQRLRLESQLDDELATAVQRFPDDPGVLMAAAETLLQASHYGYVFDQQFYRGNSTRGGVRGVFVQTGDQDRLQCLQWLHSALNVVEADPDSQGPEDLGRLYQQLAQALLFQRDGQQAWRLQSLTDLTERPVYADLSLQQSFPSSWAPCNDEGAPVLHAIPETWDAAVTDGERLRWTIERAAAIPRWRPQALAYWAEFVRSQFSVETLQEFSWRPWMTVSVDPNDPAEGVLTVHTLSDEETIARLACGVRRFTLPDDYNHIHLYRQVADAAAAGRERTARESRVDRQSLADQQTLAADLARTAHRQLIQVYLNRRQYPRAAEELQSFLKRFGRRENPAEVELLDDILQPRGMFDPMLPAVAGRPAEFSLLYRNAQGAELTARPVDLQALFRDFKEYFRSWATTRGRGFGGDPREGPPNLSNPASLFDAMAPNKYLLDSAQRWHVDLEPRENHWDRRATIEQTFDRPGLYLVDARLSAGPRSDGQIARTLVWAQDIVLTHTTTTAGTLLQVLDAASGDPVAGVTIELFGWPRNQNPPDRGAVLDTARRTDHNGQVLIHLDDEMQWVAVAWSPRGGAAFLGLQLGRSDAWEGPLDLNQVKAYGVSDRPLYRPGDTIHAKFWLARAAYGDERPALLDRVQTRIVVRDARGEEIHEELCKTDVHGGCELEFSLPASAPLGRYSFQVQARGHVVNSRTGGSSRQAARTAWVGVPTNLVVRVEEYRKPDFEVAIDAPTAPVMLGETIHARINARYFFGSPVAGARAHVRVERTASDRNWYPPHPFDWLYGPGYWWLSHDFDWYPGWETWRGCQMPRDDWIPGPPPPPPELVSDFVVHLDAMGETTIDIDTADAKRLFGSDRNQEYRITVEVQDASRRTITATGTVIAAAKPFEVYAWTDRGFYRQGDQGTIHAMVRRADGQAVSASGRLDILRITYDASGMPSERSVYQAEVATDRDGALVHRVQFPTAGQFRARFRMRDAAGHEVEGGHIFLVRGDATQPRDMRFNALEITPDRAEYAPGDTVELLVASEHSGATVMLFVRPSEGRYPPPQILHLTGKTQVVPIRVAAQDQPNFFVEAFTVHAGRFYHQVRQIAVPPVDRQLHVSLSTDQAAYRPGQPASIAVHVTDASGRPVTGSLALAVYDRALDALAADVRPVDIREYFWKWVRHHHPAIHHTADQWTGPVYIDNHPHWRPLGIFGTSLADDMDLLEGKPPGGYRADQGQARTDRVGLGMGGMGGFGGRDVPMAAMAMAEAEGAPVARRGAVDRAAGDDGEPTVRRNFADTALWAGRLTTNASGRATVTFHMPDTLTGWSVRGWAVADATRVGSAKIETVTRKDLMVRLVLPRFLVEGDEAVLSALVHNETQAAMQVNVRLEIDGEPSLRILDPASPQRQVHVPAGGMQRVDWRCRATSTGEVRLRAIAEGPRVADAMELPLPIRTHGSMRTESWAGTLRDGQQDHSIDLVVPQQRQVDQSSLVVRVSPSLAMAITDALPYLAAYPHGCTEQTLNRFLPTVIVHRALSDLGIDLQSVARHRSNLNAQEVGDAARRRAQWQRWDANPVFDADQVQRMVITGVDALTRAQNDDGGWGWFPGRGSPSSAHSTALVVRGLLVAQQRGVAIVPDVLDRGIQWLASFQAENLTRLKNADSQTIPYKTHPDPIDALVFHVLVEAGTTDTEMQQILFDQRDAIGVYGKCLLAWSAHKLGNVPQRDMLRRNIEQFLEVDPQNETAYLRIGDGQWWYWYNSDIEAMALYLKLLAAVDPRGTTAPRLVKYLLNNRKHATHWNSTRDTALVVEAMVEYLQRSGEAAKPMTVEVLWDGQRLQTLNFTPDGLFLVDNTVQLQGAALTSGNHRLQIRRSGPGNVYWNVYASHFSLQDEIEPAGLEVTVERRFYRLIPTDRSSEIVADRGQVYSARSVEFQRVPIDDLAEVPSGELVEVELLVGSRNDYEYLMLEDPRPAGFEAAETSSGYLWANGLPAYRELRDQATMLYIERLPHGKHAVHFRLRAESPGQFTALPTRIEGMYAPELRGNSADFDVRIVEPSADEPSAR